MNLAFLCVFVYNAVETKLRMSRKYDTGSRISIEYNYGKAELLNDARVFAGGEARVVLALGARAHHLARAEYERGGARRTYAHDDGRETLRIVLGIARIQSDLLQLERAAQIYCAHNVSVNCSNVQIYMNMLVETLRKSQMCIHTAGWAGDASRWSTECCRRAWTVPARRTRPDWASNWRCRKTATSADWDAQDWAWTCCHCHRRRRYGRHCHHRRCCLWSRVDRSWRERGRWWRGDGCRRCRSERHCCSPRCWAALAVRAAAAMAAASEWPDSAACEWTARIRASPFAAGLLACAVTCLSISSN